MMASQLEMSVENRDTLQRMYDLGLVLAQDVLKAEQRVAHLSGPAAELAMSGAMVSIAEV